MLNLETLQQIADALASGSTQRDAARAVGVSRGSVQMVQRAVAQGVTPAELRPVRARAERAQVRFTKCPECGAFTAQPCLACSLAGMGRKKEMETEDVEAEHAFAAFLAGGVTHPMTGSGRVDSIKS